VRPRARPTEVGMGEDRLVRTGVVDGVATLTLARPPLNILTIPMMAELDAALARVADDAALRVVVLRGEGKAFSAGVAVEDHVGDRVAPMLAAFHRIFRRLDALGCATVAVLHGPALGGGAELAAFCDLVIAAEEATIGQPEIRLGVFPPVAALHYPRRIGEARALQLLLSGRVLSAREAERIGLVDRVVPGGELERAVAESVGALADKSAAVLRLTKQAVRRGRSDDFDGRLAVLEALYTGTLMRTEDAAEGLRAFLEKRPPVWRHR
jgi:cyclohexa-1,5-dienecarbonyl-CoA hydratase